LTLGSQGCGRRRGHPLDRFALEGCRSMPSRQLNQKIVVPVVYVAAMFISILDSTVVTVALPSMATTFGVKVTAMTSISVGYLVSLAVIIPASGWLGERFGTKRVFLAALAVFTAASMLCGAAQNLPELVGFRVLQGIGGGALTPVGMTMMLQVFSQQERVRASRYLIVPTTLAPASGPIIGGLLVDNASWRWVFYVNVPLGLAVLAFGTLFLRDTMNRTDRPLDVPGFALSAVGFASVMYAASEGASLGWGSPSIVASGLVGLVLLVLLVRYELRRAEPLLDLRLFREPMFRIMNVVAGFGAATFGAILFTFPLMMQEALHRSAIQSGLLVFPEALGVMSGTQLASRIYPKFGPRRLTIGGLSCVTVVALLLSRVDGGTNQWLVRLLMYCLGAAMSQLFMANQMGAFANISKERTPGGSALFNARAQMSMASGTAIMGSVLAAVGVTRHTSAGVRPYLGAYHVAFEVCAGLALGGLLFGFLIRDRAVLASFQQRQAPADEATDPEPAAAVD
jgi:EmrB/QacA subfamily drug resistance transporter